MMISRPLSSSAKNAMVVSQCVMRTKRAWRGRVILLAVHLGDESSQRSRIPFGECAELPAKSLLVDGADLVDRHLGVTVSDADTEPGAPFGVKLARERADRNGVEPLVEDIEAHDND